MRQKGKTGDTKKDGRGDMSETKVGRHNKSRREATVMVKTHQEQKGGNIRG